MKALRGTAWLRTGAALAPALLFSSSSNSRFLRGGPLHNRHSAFTARSSIGRKK